MKYAVINNRGHVAGHDLDQAHAEQVLEQMEAEAPSEEWEIIEME